MKGDSKRVATLKRSEFLFLLGGRIENSRKGGWCSLVTDAGVRARALAAAPALASINLTNCSRVTDAGVWALASAGAARLLHDLHEDIAILGGKITIDASKGRAWLHLTARTMTLEAIQERRAAEASPSWAPSRETNAAVASLAELVMRFEGLMRDLCAMPATTQREDHVSTEGSVLFCLRPVGENLATARTQGLAQTARYGMILSSAYTRPVFREGFAATL
jgi:hypothetical protein